LLLSISLAMFSFSFAQKQQMVKLVKEKDVNRINVFIGNKPFTSFFYPYTLEKPVLYPIIAANGTIVTRGFPLNPRAGEPTDHPHHIGMWFNFENVNKLDFWNNSFAIPKEKKNMYGWIKTDRIAETKDGTTGSLTYHANWTNQQNETLLEETTSFEFSGTDRLRIIDRITTLKAATEVNFTDAKDGLLGFRLAQALQIPTMEDKKFTDDKGIVTVVKGRADSIANGNYITSEGKEGDAAWSTRGRWCKVYAKMGKDSVSVIIIDHPENPNYPTFWHARGYGLFAANPLGEKVFTNGASAKNLQLKKGESVVFRFRIVVDDGNKTINAKEINALADAFGKKP
ncbi:MAG TPA: PmoA family protein, partial [Chitinophagaceae bacterium]|nr:PmoA family protein [Chitinophagaceae bacterium]